MAAADQDSRANSGYGAAMSHTATCHLDPAHSHELEHDDHGHSHGLVDESIKRSREGLRAVVVTLVILGMTAVVQGAIYLSTGSIALLADLIHNFGDALTALPLGIAFALRSAKAERYAGLAVVLTILASAVIAGAFAVEKLITRQPPTHLLALAAAGVVGIVGNAIAAQIRSSAGRRLNSPALIADGAHARSDALVSAGVVLSAAMVWAGFPIADPIIGLVITAMILHITWESWHTVRGGHGHKH
jgi:cation diffusion facilitator family transporter